MAVARKPPAKPAKTIAAAPLVSAPVTIEDPIIPALEETIEATLETAGEIQDQVRKTAEEGVEQTRKIFERLKVVSDEANTSLETTYASVSKGVSTINMKALDAFKANAEAQLAFVKALMATKSVAEAFTLQSEHARTQFETMNAQAKELGELIRQVTAETVEPIKTTFTKTLQVAA